MRGERLLERDPATPARGGRVPRAAHCRFAYACFELEKSEDRSGLKSPCQLPGDHWKAGRLDVHRGDLLCPPYVDCVEKLAK